MKQSVLNMQWSKEHGWEADCPACQDSQVLKWQKGATSYTCPTCGATFPQPELVKMMTLSDYLNYQPIRREIFKHAQEGFQKDGRGVVVLMIEGYPKMNPQTKYLPASLVEERLGWPDETIAGWVYAYDPSAEAIIHIMGNDGSVESWQRFWVGPGAQG